MANDEVWPMSMVGNHPRVYLIVPFSDTVLGVEYGRTCLVDCLNRGESPIAASWALAHCMSVEEHPDIALGRALEWIDVVHKVVLYDNFGIDAMGALQLQYAGQRGYDVEIRQLNVTDGFHDDEEAEGAA